MRMLCSLDKGVNRSRSVLYATTNLCLKCSVGFKEGLGMQPKKSQHQCKFLKSKSGAGNSMSLLEVVLVAANLTFKESHEEMSTSSAKVVLKQLIKRDTA